MAKVQQMPLSSMSMGNLYGRSSSEVKEPMPKDFPMGMRVIVVDDDTTCLKVLERMLLECGYNACTMATRALSILRESKGGFDVVISDVHMPDMDGFKLLELIGLEMDLPVIMMSADMRTSIVMQGIKHGACDYLAKPVRMEELKNIWQHVVRKKWKENREAEHSDSFEDTDHNRQVIDDAEKTSSGNDATDSICKSQKKRRDCKEDDEGEPDNMDSSSKKPRVVWSVELHQQFVNAVNQLGVDRAVPKRILDLMDVPGLTRENVASHLQKFRLYLKRLSSAQHHTGLPISLPGAGSNAEVPSLGSLDFQTLTISGQIPPQTLAAWQDELLGRPAGSLGMPEMDQPILPQASIRGAKSVPVEHGIVFGQPLRKCQANMPRQFPQSNVAVRGLSSGFPTWSSNNLGAVVSGSNLGGLSSTQNSNLLVPMLQQEQPHPVLSESHRAMTVQPSCLVLPSQVSKRFQVREKAVLVDQNSVVVPSQSSTSLQAENNPTPMNQTSIFAPPRSSASMQAGNNLSLIGLNSSSTSFQGGNDPGLINQNCMLVPPQLLTSFQEGSGTAPLSYSSRYKNSSAIVDYSLLSSQSNNAQLGRAQVSDEGFKDITVLNKYSIPKSIYSSVPSCTDVSTGWRAQTPDGNIGPVNQSPCLVPNLINVQGAGAVSQTLPNQGQGRNLGLPNLSNIRGGETMSQTLPDQGQGRSLGFIGQGTRMPCQFAVDDIKSPTNGSGPDDDRDILNQAFFGFNGDP
ncbi:two-component response regulator ORR21 isoform X2 [Phoenix dactylifera]|uniref:Two-component response regulator ORR21 isoform X2 n=1 Tax=Phoenix dactylifera TaxID=42345 RepID=A0A8B9ANJ9_PHODC|nr:two-component response regulator ORR21 isoform X2 [Phoenix dactylifera]